MRCFATPSIYDVVFVSLYAQNYKNVQETTILSALINFIWKDRETCIISFFIQCECKIIKCKFTCSNGQSMRWVIHLLVSSLHFSTINLLRTLSCILFYFTTKNKPFLSKSRYCGFKCILQEKEGKIQCLNFKILWYKT